MTPCEYWISTEVRIVNNVMLKVIFPAHGVDRVVGALCFGTEFAGSMLNYNIFHDACNSLI